MPAAFAILKRTTSPSRSRSWRNSTASRRGTTTSTSRPASSSAASTRSRATFFPSRGPRWARDSGRSASCWAAQLEQQLRAAFLSDAPDHRILNTALLLERQESHRQVVLVTKDTNLRMKAKALGVTAQDYTSDKVESVDTLYSGKRVVENMPERGDRRFLQREPRGGPREPAAGRRSEGQRELHPPQRLEIGAGRLSAREPRLREGEQGLGLRHQAPQRRAIVRAGRPVEPGHQAGDADGQGRLGQDAAGLGRRAGVPLDLSADPPGPADGAAEQSRPGLSARRHCRQARPVHEAAARQPDGDPPRVGRQGPQRPADRARCWSPRSW